MDGGLGSYGLLPMADTQCLHIYIYIIITYKILIYEMKCKV